jgi:arylformamidase
MGILDISRVLEPDMTVWPGDTAYQIERVLNLDQGEAVNLTTLTMSAHTGTHVDAPLHFTEGGHSIEELDLEPYWGAAQVVTSAKRAGPLEPKDLEGYDLSRARRLLVRSLSRDYLPDQFPESYVYPSPTLAEYLGSLSICLYGSDGPSMDDVNSRSLEGHHALRRQNIAILEWLDFRKVPDGIYELVAMPLKIAGGDGSPVRAVLRTM